MTMQPAVLNRGPLHARLLDVRDDADAVHLEYHEGSEAALLTYRRTPAHVTDPAGVDRVVFVWEHAA